MAKDKFSYQNLRVYEDLIRSISLAEDAASSWSSVHAIADHFSRASEGALVCLAEACRTRQTAPRNNAADYSLGSILECVACFDIAACKSLCTKEKSNEVKQEFSLVFRQLYALKKSWKGQEVRDDVSSYGKMYFFNHERLELYQIALQINCHIASWQLLDRLSSPDFRRIDEAATSIVLNVAEGNGRFFHLDHGRFLEIANRSNTKLAARIEICALRGGIHHDEAKELIRLLVNVDRMTAKLADVWRNQKDESTDPAPAGCGTGDRDKK